MVSKSSSRQTAPSTSSKSASRTAQNGTSSILKTSFCPSALQLSLFASVIQSLDTHQLRIHDTLTGELKCEYSPPREHITCINWASCGHRTNFSGSQPAKKKRRRQEAVEGANGNNGAVIAIGTKRNYIELFSPFESKIVGVLNPAHDSGTQDFKCQHYGSGSQACSLGLDGSLILWDLSAKVQVRKFRAPVESISSLAFFESSILLASHAAYLVDPESPHIIQRFPGFQNMIHSLVVPPGKISGNKNVTFLAAAQQSRYINAYNVETGSLLGTLTAGNDVRRAVVPEDIGRWELESSKGVLAAIAADGTVDLFSTPFDWERLKSAEGDLKSRSKMSTRKAKATIRIMNSNSDMRPTTVLDASFQDSNLVLAITEGTANASFERISWADDVGNWLLSGSVEFNRTRSMRFESEPTNGVKDLSHSHVNESEAIVIQGSDLHERIPVNGTQEVIEISSAEEESEDGDSQHEAVPHDANTTINGIVNGYLEKPNASGERDGEQSQDEVEEPTFGDLIRTKSTGPIDVVGLLPNIEEHALVPAEKTLELTGNLSLGTVLAQSLRTNDRSLLESCLRVQDLQVVRATIERLGSDLAINLLQNLAERLHSRPGRAGSLLVWVQWTLVAHGGYLASRPDVVKRLAVLHGVVRERAKSLQPLLSLKGRLDMLEAQLNLRRSLQRNNEAAAGRGKLQAPAIYVEGQDDSNSDSEEDDSVIAAASHSQESGSETEYDSSNDMEGEEDVMNIDEEGGSDGSTEDGSSDSGASIGKIEEEDVDYDDVDSNEELENSEFKSQNGKPNRSMRL